VNYTPADGDSVFIIDPQNVVQVSFARTWSMEELRKRLRQQAELNSLLDKCRREALERYIGDPANFSFDVKAANLEEVQFTGHRYKNALGEVWGEVHYADEPIIVEDKR
jgi:hypothetical protein